MKKYVNLPLSRFTVDISAKTATPGGGSASAAAAALGISLLMMSANFSIRKDGTAGNNSKIKKILSGLLKAHKQALDMIDEDIKLYGAVDKAFKLSRTSDRDIKYRSKKLQSALKKSAASPVRVLEISAGVVTAAEKLIETGNKNLISDTYCGVSFLRAAIETAKYNIDANLKYISDAAYKNFIRKKSGKLIRTANARLDRMAHGYESKTN